MILDEIAEKTRARVEEDKKQIPLIQILSVVKAKFYLKLGNNKKAKEQLINLRKKATRKN